ncbi:MAG TPA: hypothetical protein DCY51_07605 [Bacteroidetes bacterium]|nr:hypothetical protein [Bacteroidota bacterium]
MPIDKTTKSGMPKGMLNSRRRGRDLSTPLAPSKFDYRDVGADQLMKMQAKQKKIKRDKIAKMTADQAIKAFNSTMQTPG